jgi:hypothetical protein
MNVNMTKNVVVNLPKWMPNKIEHPEDLCGDNAYVLNTSMSKDLM